MYAVTVPLPSSHVCRRWTFKKPAVVDWPTAYARPAEQNGEGDPTTWRVLLG